MKVFKIFGKEILAFGNVEEKNFNTELKKILFSDDADSGSEQVTKSNAYRTYVWIYASVQAIATNVARCKLKFYNKATKEEIKSTLNTALFESPVNLTSSQLFEGIMTYKCLTGEAFLHIDMNGGKKPLAIYLLDPRKIKEVIVDGKLTYWKYTNGNTTRDIPANEVLHFKYFNPDNQIRGLSPLDPAWQGVVLDNDVKRFNQSTLNNGSAVGGLIEVAETMGDEAYTRLKTAFEQRHKGQANAGRVAILEGGAKYKDFKLTNQEMSYIEQRKLSREEILAVYKVPPIEVGLTSEINYANASAQMKQFWTKKLIPEMNAIEDVINQGFLSQFEPNVFCNFDVAEIAELQEDVNMKIDSGTKLFAMGFTGNEINKKLNFGFEDKPWRDIWLVSPMLTPAPGSDIQGEPQQEEPAPIKNIKNFISLLDGIGDKAEKEKAIDNIMWKRWDAELKPIEKAYASKISRLMFQWRKQVLDKYDAKGMHRDTKAVGLLDIVKASNDLIKASSPFISQSIQIGGETALEGIPDEQFNIHDPNVVKYIREKNIKLKGIVYTIDRQINEALAEGIRSLMTRTEIANNFKDIFNFGGNRADMIAQTELTSASNFGRMSAMLQAGFTKKKWISSQDDRVRDSHQINGEEQNIDEPFSNGLMQPGDQEGSAEEVINCRCTFRPVME